MPPPLRALSYGDHVKEGGTGRTRTDYLLSAKQALSQMSYGPEGLTDAAPTLRRRLGRVAVPPHSSNPWLSLGLRQAMPVVLRGESPSA